MPLATSWLANGFRPFFLGAALWAVLALAHWLHMLAGIGTEDSLMDPLAWHRHEMIFGYGGAVITGFLLTAIPSWTGRLPIRGGPLLLLFALWLLGRPVNLASAHLGGIIAAVVDAGFLWVMAALAAREVIAGKNHKNLPVVLVLAALALGSSLDHAGIDAGWRLGLAAIVLLIALIGGRITPSFTRNWLAKRGEKHLPAPFDRLDRAALLVIVAALALFVSLPDRGVTAVALMAGGLALLLRLTRWRGLLCLEEPLVWIMHLGYGWIGLGLVLMGLTGLLPDLPISAVHVVTAGGIATMTMAIMTRASLGHTGRPLHAGPATLAVYLLISSGALLRIVAELLPFDCQPTIRVAGLLWGGGFLLFALVYGPLLVRSKARAGG